MAQDDGFKVVRRKKGRRSRAENPIFTDEDFPPLQCSALATVMGYGSAAPNITGSVQCENVVKVGSEILCDVDMASVTSLQPGTVSVNVENNGEAVQKVSEDTAGDVISSSEPPTKKAKEEKPSNEVTDVVTDEFTDTRLSTPERENSSAKVKRREALSLIIFLIFPSRPR